MYEPKEWYDVGHTSPVRTWPVDGDAGNPFKARRSPLRDMPSCDTSLFIKPDPAHVYAINGWGKDFVASSIVLLLHLGCFGRAGNTSAKLSSAFDNFKTWCQLHHKTTSLTEFSLKAFKVQKYLGD